MDNSILMERLVLKEAKDFVLSTYRRLNSRYDQREVVLVVVGRIGLDMRNRDWEPEVLLAAAQRVGEAIAALEKGS